MLVCERKSSNSDDRYAVAVKRDEVVVGHLPKKYLEYAQYSF